MSNKFYITTSIMYANSKPHVGFALELFQADFMARIHRLMGHDTFFLTGTDENGLKNFRTAVQDGLSPQMFVDQNSQLVKDFALNHQVTISDFIRTSDKKRHWPAAQKIWTKLAEKQLLEKRKYSGWYCVGCESFKKENDLNESGECPIHLKKPEKIEEENYFFKLSTFSAQILEQINSRKLRIMPVERENEIKYVLEQGLQDISFSRPSKTLPWGIPVPNDPEHVMYVWCDALTNYISALGYGDSSSNPLFKKYWPANVHLIGKDIIRFHAAIWPAMLLASDLPLPQSIFVHGFILSGGQKMSKSIGNVIDPVVVSSKYGASALRLILLKEISAFTDGDLTLDRIDEVYHSELANKLGNLVSRVFAMTQKYFQGQIPDQKPVLEIPIQPIDPNEFLDLDKYFGRHDIYLQKVWDLIDIANKYVDDQKPWELAKKEDQNKLQIVILNLLETIRIIALLLEPCDPSFSQKILKSMSQEYLDSSHNIPEPKKFADLLEWGHLKTKIKIETIPPLFPKIE